MSAKATYRYEALTPDSRLVSGTIDVPGDNEGREQLRQLGLSIRLFEPVAPIRAQPLSANDLNAFNDQLAQLARAGLPVEQGLKLLASDMSKGRLKNAVAAVTRDLDAGRTLPEAINAHRAAFPPLYANIVEAGIRVNNLPAVLFNLSRHLDLTRRMRAAISRSIAYPVMVLLAIVVLSAFLTAWVFPLLQAALGGAGRSDPFATFGFKSRHAGRSLLPLVTEAAIAFGTIAPYVAGASVALVVLSALLWPLLRGTSAGRAFSDHVLMRLPLFGPPLRLTIVGRWCDAMRIGIAAGLDLPASLAMASQTVASPRLSADGDRLVAAASSGGRLSDVQPLAVLPAAVPAAIQIASVSNTLPQTLDALSALYLRQAEARARLIPLVLTPILVIILALVLGLLLTALFAPLVQLLEALT